MISVKTLIGKAFSVFLAAVLMLSISFSVTGNAAFLTQTANANPVLTVNFNNDYTDAPYANVRNTDLVGCLQACGKDLTCQAYTYNPKGINNDGFPVCWLKKQGTVLSSVPTNLGVATGSLVAR